MVPRWSRCLVYGALSVIMVVACSGGDGTPSGPETGPPAELEIISGNGQEGEVGRALAEDVVIRVLDNGGHPVPGVTVTFDGTASGSSFAPPTAPTDAEGKARASWSLGATAGTIAATATVDGLAPEALTAEAVAGAATELLAIGGEGQHAVVGSAVPVAPTVEVLDGEGNPVAGVTIDFEASGGGGVTPASLVTGGDGRAAPDEWTLGTATGQNVLRVTSPAVAGAAVEFRATATTGPISAAVSTVSVSASGRLTGETALITVTVKDAFGNPVQGVEVDLDATGSGHTLLQPDEPTDARGETGGSIHFTQVGPTTVSAAAGTAPLDQTVPVTVSYGEGTRTGVTYCTIGGVSSVMDVYEPSASHARPLPVAVHVHGGGYTSGSRSAGFFFADISQELLDRGYLVVSVDYRLAPAHKYPSQIQDVKCAIRHLRANADTYGLNPEQIGAWGSSAGAQLVGLLGTTDASAGFDDVGGFQGESSEVGAVVALSAITDFTRTSELNDNYGAEFPTWPDPASSELIEASPARHISDGDSPFLFIAGEDDDLVLPAQSQRMSQLLHDEGIASTVLMIAHADHALEPTTGPIVPGVGTIVNRMADFFDLRLR